MFKSILLLLGLIILSALLIGCATNLSISSVEVGVSPITYYASPGELIKFKINLAGSGLSRIKSVKVRLEHFLIQKDTGRIIEKKVEDVEFKNSGQFTRGVQIPSSAVFGDYRLATIARMKEQSSSVFFDFKIGETFAKELGDHSSSLELMADEFLFIPETLQDSQEELIEIVIQGYKAVPEKVVVRPRTKVRWTNKDSISHTVTGAGFDSGSLKKNDEFVHQFNESGLRYIYKSTLHNRVLGEIIVKED